MIFLFYSPYIVYFHNLCPFCLIFCFANIFIPSKNETSLILKVFCYPQTNSAANVIISVPKSPPDGISFSKRAPKPSLRINPILCLARCVAHFVTARRARIFLRVEEEAVGQWKGPPSPFPLPNTPPHFSLKNPMSSKKHSHTHFEGKHLTRAYFKNIAKDETSTNL